MKNNTNLYQLPTNDMAEDAINTSDRIIAKLDEIHTMLKWRTQLLKNFGYFLKAVAITLAAFLAGIGAAHIVKFIF
jgi:hypothetical protein